MPQVSANMDTRRAFPRYGAELPVRIRPANSASEAEGLMLNVSRGGALIRTAIEIVVGERYLIRFVAEDNEIENGPHECPSCGHRFPKLYIPRQSVWACARRVGAGAGGTSVGFTFEALIEILEEAPRVIAASGIPSVSASRADRTHRRRGLQRTVAGLPAQCAEMIRRIAGSDIAKSRGR